MIRFKQICWPLALALAVFGFSGGPALAQDGGNSCPALVSQALATVDDACAGLGRDEACYGHNRVEVVFRQPHDPADFDAPADRVDLSHVQTLATAPLDLTSGTWGLAVASLRANLPEALPGQAITFLLMGSAALENAAAPEDTASGPMQAFYFTTGLDAPSCAEAPSALVVQSPQGAVVTLRINDLEMQIGSTVVLFMTQVNGQPVMVVALLEGHLQTSVNGVPVDLQAASGQPAAVAITLNVAGRVDAASLVIPAPESAAPTILAVQQNIGHLALFGRCTVTASRTVNLRGGPGTDYPVQGQLEAGQSAAVSGKAPGADGSEWWQLGSGAWVRADLVTASGDCEATVPVIPAPSGGGGSVSGLVEPVHYSVDTCTRHVPGEGTVVAAPIYAGQNIHLHFTHPVPPGTPAAEWENIRGAITVNGASLEVFYLLDQFGGYSMKSDAWDNVSAGTYTVSAWLSSGESNTCTLTVEPAPLTSSGGPPGTHEAVTFLPITYCSVSAGGVSPWRLRANTPLTIGGGRPSASDAQAQASASYFTTQLTIDGTSYGEGTRWLNTQNCPSPVCVQVEWTTPPLSPGQHTLVATYTIMQEWHWGTGPNDFSGPGTVGSDTCVITAE